MISPSQNVTPQTIFFDEDILTRYPDFTPNLTPKQIFEKGAFHNQGGYFRPIYSLPLVNNNLTFYKDRYTLYTQPGRCLENIDPSLLVTDLSQYSTKSKMNRLNFYKVKSGTDLDYWLERGWIHELHPYGWVEWYCDFYDGKRCVDDDRQIKRWIDFSSHKYGRWRKTLINNIKKSNKNFNDFSVSPAIRQSLLHWAYELTESDFKLSSLGSGTFTF